MMKLIQGIEKKIQKQLLDESGVSQFRGSFSLFLGERPQLFDFHGPFRGVGREPIAGGSQHLASEILQGGGFSFEVLAEC